LYGKLKFYLVLFPIECPQNLSDFTNIFKLMGKQKHKKKRSLVEKVKDDKTEILDERFSNFQKDPRFKKFPSRSTKVVIDERFSRMFEDEDFLIQSKYDARGKKLDQSEKKLLQKFYHLPGENELNSKKPNKNDEKKSETEATESELDSSDLEDLDKQLSENIPNEESYEVEEEVSLGEATERIAVLNCDWEKLKAVDLLVLFQSFLPIGEGGRIKRISIYPSDYGLRKMAEEDLHGPNIFLDNKEKMKTNSSEEKFELASSSEEERKPSDEDYDEDDTHSGFDLENLRRYELNKLKYYFAVIECDTVKTASKLYKQCDGIEIESTSNLLDLRYIPRNVQIEKVAREVATEVPANYKPPEFFYTKALQHSKVECSWDSTDYRRAKLVVTKFTKEQLEEMDFSAYLASDSESSDQEIQGTKSNEKNNEKTMNKARSSEKYRLLLDAIQNEKQPKEEENMEITFIPGLSEKTESLVEKVSLQKEETLWEQALRKKQERRKENKKKKQAANDKDPIVEKKIATRGKNKEDEGDDLLSKANKEKAELELIALPDIPNAKQFISEDPISLVNKENEKSIPNSKRKKTEKKAKEMKLNGFEFDTNDSRWAPIYENSDFAIDPTHKRFKKSEATKAILNERLKRRNQMDTESENGTLKSSLSETGQDWTSLVQSVKRKVKQHKAFKSE